MENFKSIWIEISANNERCMVNLHNVKNVTLNIPDGETGLGSIGRVCVNYIDGTYSIFNGTHEEMNALYYRMQFAISRLTCFIACDENVKVERNGMPNLDQCVLITEEDNKKHITKL